MNEKRRMRYTCLPRCGKPFDCITVQLTLFGLKRHSPIPQKTGRGRCHQCLLFTDNHWLNFSRYHSTIEKHGSASFRSEPCYYSSVAHRLLLLTISPLTVWDVVSGGHYWTPSYARKWHCELQMVALLTEYGEWLTSLRRHWRLPPKQKGEERNPILNIAVAWVEANHWSLMAQCLVLLTYLVLPTPLSGS